MNSHPSFVLFQQILSHPVWQVGFEDTGSFKEFIKRFCRFLSGEDTNLVRFIPVNSGVIIKYDSVSLPDGSYRLSQALRAGRSAAICTQGKPAKSSAGVVPLSTAQKGMPARWAAPASSTVSPQ